MGQAHVLQHVAFEGPGTIGPWLARAGYCVQTTRCDHGDPLPDPADVDLLVIMGGPMSVHDTARFPWLVDEIRFVEDCVRRAVPTLGVCLGAQIIAAASGARVFPNPAPEIGWYPIRGIRSDPGVDVFRFPAETTVFHWHGETFDLPPGAIHLAESDACRHQAFQLGRSVVGLQFHLETTPELVNGLVEHAGSDLVPSRYVQPATDLLRHDPARYAGLEPLLDAVLSFLAGARPATR
jgi:GMP synthase-like glutamine amidotransferase